MPLNHNKRGSGAPGGRWPDDTNELELEDVEIIEEDAPAPGASRLGPSSSSPSRLADFDASLADALGVDTARDIAALKQKRKKRKRVDLPPDQAAMANRPMEASGEVRLFDADDLGPTFDPSVPQTSEGGVEVSADVGPGEDKEGTARIKRPKGLDDPAAPAGMGKKAKMGVVVGVTVVAVLGLGVAGIVIWRKRTRARRSREIKRKHKLMKLRLKLRKGRVSPMLPGKCPPFMVWINTDHTIPGPGFCIDMYEYPNRKGKRPEAVADHQSAVQACWKFGKRLCTRAEWRRVCGGKKGLKFPYGAVYHPSKCVSKPPGAEAPPVQLSGSWADCKSEEGVFDLSGNVAEWVKEGVPLGGSGALTGDDTACTAEGRGGGPAYYGTRCCLSPIGGN